jgi:predicted DNA-binding transcriptional regulator AlpA
VSEHEPDKRRAERILRLSEVRRRIPVGKTKLHEDFIKTGRLNLVHLGPRAVGCLESNVERVIDELVEESK